MKKFIYVLLASFAIVFNACNQTPRNNTGVGKDTTSNPEAVEKSSYKVFAVVDSVASVYPKKYTNDIQKKKFCEALFNAIDAKLKADNNYLSEIPLKFSQMLEKGGGKYILKFECGKYSTDDEGLNKDDYAIDFAIFVEATEAEASELETNKIYTLTGTYVGNVNGKLSLPSGRVFDYNTNCYTTSSIASGDTGSICLGGFLFKDITVK